MTYPEALDYLASLAPRGWRLGLDRMQEFLRRADLTGALGGSPESPKFLHVAGTNGKGSTTAFLQSILVESGYWTGAFFSPFVYDPRERIQFNRTMIPENVFAMMTQLMRPVAESLTDTEFGGVTEFEFKTALGFAFWKQLECEYVALETGLGGRLDATNVVTPVASVIVSIGLDHTNILGHSLEEIAFEKAGIIKPGVPVVIGALPRVALDVIERVAVENQSPVWRFGREVVVETTGTKEYAVVTPAGRHEGLVPGIPGAMQHHNMALAVAAIDAAGAGRTLRGYVDGCRNASIPGRFERMKFAGVNFIMDGAHNPEAAENLVQSLADFEWRLASTDVKRPTRIVLLTGMVAGHEPLDFYRVLAPKVATAHVVPIDTPRTLSPAVVADALRDSIAEVTAYDNMKAGLEAAIDDAGPDGLVLVTGSFYLVGDVGRELIRGTSTSR